MTLPPYAGVSASLSKGQTRGFGATAKRTETRTTETVPCYPSPSHAKHRSAREKGPDAPEEEGFDARPEVEPARQAQDRRPPAARRLHPGLHDHAEEAELGAPQGRPRAPHERHG